MKFVMGNFLTCIFFFFCRGPSVLQLLSVQIKITRVEQLISHFIRESRDNIAGEPVFYAVLWSDRAAVSSPRCLFPVYQRQFDEKSALLIKKIAELSQDMNNTKISKCAAQHGVFLRFSFVFLLFCSPAREILRLQIEVDKAESLLATGKKTSELRIAGETLELHQICKRNELKGRICCSPPKL